jgi:Transposase IS4
MENQPRMTDPTYDPAYKVKELQDLLQERYEKLYIPGRYLSLDETLVRAFGRIKFKVCIITKSARYGIKLYVVTDAETAFVLYTIIYTGTYTYFENENENMKKTVAVVKRLCEPFEGTHRTIFVDRFYTSIDLMKELDKMSLYDTGTVMRSRLPKEITIARASREFKDMERGEHIMHRFS